MEITENNKRDLVKIIMKYDDGTEEIIEKGVVITVKPSDEEETETITLDFANISGREATNIVHGVTQFGIRAGMFGDRCKEESENI